MNSSLFAPRTKARAFHSIDSDHCHEPAGAGETARLTTARGIAGVELLYGKYRRFSFAKHFHSVPAIGVVETGTMRTCCNRAMHDAAAGTVILFNAGDVHAPQPANDAGWSFRMIYLDQNLLSDMARFSERLQQLWFATPFVESRKLHSRIVALHRLLEHDPDPLASESRVCGVLHEIARFSSWNAGSANADPGVRRVERVREYLHARCAETVNLRTLSDLVELSPFHLLRSFRAHVGMTPHAYHMQIRVERGRMLLATGASIAEAAIESGFSDQSHFTRQFKRFTGATPGQYCAS